MKKIYILLVLFSLSSIARSQDNQPVIDEKKAQDIEALKVAYISKELELTPEEAQRFWPVYNQYSQEMKELRRAAKDNNDVLDRDEKVLNLRKHYRDQFSKILGPQRMNRLYDTEGHFQQLLIKAMRKRQEYRNEQNQNPNRPYFRKER